MKSHGTAVAATLCCILWGCDQEKKNMTPAAMTLDICGERTITNPSDQDIRNALAGLDARSGDAFVILGQEMTYIQASGDRESGFDLEYQEGSIQQHFRADRDDIPLDDIAGALILYRDGDPDWQSGFKFERITW